MKTEKQRGTFLPKGEGPEKAIIISGRQDYSPNHPKRVDVWVISVPDDEIEHEFATYKLVKDHLANRYCGGDVNSVQIDWVRS